MQTENRFIDDIAKLASGAAGALHGVREEIEAAVRSRVERMAAELDLIPREEFEAVREMAAKARAENEELKARIEKLEAKIGKASKPASASKASGKKA